MREAFGRHTAATASQIGDSAAALLVVNERGLKLLGGSAKPLARVHQMTVLRREKAPCSAIAANASGHRQQMIVVTSAALI